MILAKAITIVTFFKILRRNMNYSELNEKKVHGTFDFPMEYSRLDRSHRAYVMKLHWHDEMELVRVEQGCFHLHLNNRSYDLHAGDIAFINPGVLHRGDPEDCVYSCAVFRLNMLCPTGSIIDRYLRPISRQLKMATERMACGDCPAVEQAVDRLFAALHGGESKYELEVFSALYQMIFALYREDRIVEVRPHAAQDRRLAQITKLLEWISEHYTQRITLERLSKESGLNEKYLCRFFKEYTSYTPIEYINRLRVEKVIDDMITKQLSVTEAAFANGFNDSAYFSKVFQRIKGTQPTSYVKRLKEDRLHSTDS